MSGTEDAEICGTLYEELGEVAERVARITGEHPVLVWADESGNVSAIDVANAPPIPASWVAGTFDATADPGDIKQDLRLLLRERVKRWMVE